MAEDIPKQGRRVPIEFDYPGDVITRHATNLVIQHSKHEFILSFFEVHHPLLLGDLDDRLAQLDSVAAVRADCVARIVLAPGRMRRFVAAMQENLEVHERAIAAGAPEDDE